MNIFAADNNIVKIVVNLIAYRGNAGYSLFVPALPNNVIVENTRHKYKKVMCSGPDIIIAAHAKHFFLSCRPEFLNDKS
jgi:hypothetical protein